MTNSKASTTTSRTFTAAMLVLGMSLGTTAALAPATADAAAAKADSRYKVAISEAKGAKVGEKTSVTVTLTADDPWHMNTDFPTGLKLTAPGGVKVAKAKLGKGDAKTLSEHKIEFVVDMTPSKPGAQTVKGQLKFAICKKDACSPAKAAVSIPLKVAPAAKKAKKGKKK